MKLREVIDRAEVLEVRCNDCRARTPLDPAFFAARRGAEIELGVLRHRLVCPGCGSSDFELRSSRQAPTRKADEHAS